MSKDASTNSALTFSSQEERFSRFHSVNQATESSQFSANTYAERLMDDLFQDLEHLLDMPPVSSNTDAQPSRSSSEVPIQPHPPQPASEESGLALPLARIETISVPAPMPPSDRALVESKDPPTTSPAAAKPSAPPKRNYERLLLAVGCISVVMSLALYLLHQEGRIRQQAVTPDAASSVAVQSTDAQNPFADYAQKVLRNIHQQAPQTATLPAAPGNAGAPTMPTVTIPPTNSPSPLPNRTATGLERVYVPVYKIPSNLYPAGTGVAPLPSTGLPKTPAKSKSKPAIARTSTVARKLVGVLDQGNRSVALFETNGVTQRYELGESIGSSGWTLVEVTKDQAVIRRNGDVRSLFVGHSFQ